MKTTIVTTSVGLVTLLCGSCGAPQDGDVGAVESSLTSCPADWSVVPSPSFGAGDNALSAVAGSAANDVWAVGQYAPEANPNMTLSLTLHFDGRAWSVIDTPNAGTRANALLSVAAKAGQAWAVGYDIGHDFLSHSLIEAWDGSAWHVVTHPHRFDTENLYGVSAAAPNDVWAVGSGRNDEGGFQTLALHFDGRAWSVAQTVNPGTSGNVLYGVVARSADDVWAVGQKLGDAGPDGALIEHWDGMRWTEVAAPGAGAASAQLIAVDDVRGDVRAVGDLQDGAHSLRTFALGSESRSFSLQPTANPSVRDNRLTGIAAVGDEESWAVGSTLDATTEALGTLIVHGGESGKWTAVPSPNPSADGDNQLSSIARVGRDLWAVGAFDGEDAAQTLILRRCR